MKQRRSFSPLLLILAALALVAAVWSFVLLSTPHQETLDQRVQDVASQLKCPVCQNESVATSPALLAQQMRFVIRQQLQEGKSEQEVIQNFVKSYGGQIIWSPPWQGFTLLIWLVPIGLLLGGIALLFFVLRDWRNSPPAENRDTAAKKEHTNAVESEENEQATEGGLERYRALLEEELAADDPLFARQRPEGVR